VGRKTLGSIVIIHKFSAGVTIDVREMAGGIDKVECVLDDYWVGE